jgi:hypothetical protein
MMAPSSNKNQDKKVSFAQKGAGDSEAASKGDDTQKSKGFQANDDLDFSAQLNLMIPRHSIDSRKLTQPVIGGGKSPINGEMMVDEGSSDFEESNFSLDTSSLQGEGGDDEASGKIKSKRGARKRP